MFNIGYWYNNFQAPSVLMIDDVSDAYIEVYDEAHKNDWGYLGDQKNSAYRYLSNHLLAHYPHIKITFFIPYERHNVINDHAPFNFKKYALGEREVYSDFLKKLILQGHEIAHHGSNHGTYIDPTNPSTIHNWIHEWELFKDVETGVATIQKGVKAFKKYCDVNITGGKYCGYKRNQFSDEMIDQCHFLYWCRTSNIATKNHHTSYFGHHSVIDFPTNFAGNAFIRLSYMSGKKRRDQKKKILKYFQPLYSLYSYVTLYRLYRQRDIISIQEHISPSTSAGTVQSANIITDIKSLQTIYHFLSKLSIWYATCEKIAKYIYVRDHTTLHQSKRELTLTFDNQKMVEDGIVSITHHAPFSLQNGPTSYHAKVNHKRYVVNLPLQSGENHFHITSMGSKR